MGGLIYAIGQNTLTIDKSESSIKEILDILKMKSKDKKILDNNIMISINGIDSNVLGGPYTSVSEQDKIVAVTIVHGG
jgi:hypothetical protein